MALPKNALFHGTSEYVIKQIRSGTNKVRRVYTDSNVSLGGTYLTVYRNVAEVAAHRHKSVPVVATVRVKYPLLPDEDWVVRAAERPLDKDFDWTTETYKTKRYQDFFADLFSEYIGEGHSLSDEYARRYDKLNEQYGITWKDSLRYIGSVRQAQPLDADQIVVVIPM